MSYLTAFLGFAAVAGFDIIDEKDDAHFR